MKTTARAIIAISVFGLGMWYGLYTTRELEKLHHRINETNASMAEMYDSQVQAPCDFEDLVIQPEKR